MVGSTLYNSCAGILYEFWITMEYSETGAGRNSIGGCVCPRAGACCECVKSDSNLLPNRVKQKMPRLTISFVYQQTTKIRSFRFEKLPGSSSRASIWSRDRHLSGFSGLIFWQTFDVIYRRVYVSHEIYIYIYVTGIRSFWVINGCFIQLNYN